MADYKKIIPFIQKWEGGFVDDPLDKGGATNMGVTIATFRQFYGKERTVEDLKAITHEQWNHIFKKGYWDRWKADKIDSQSIADILVDWLWCSGVWGIKIPQRILEVTDDGKVGKITLAAVNDTDPKELFKKIKDARITFIDDICKRTPTNERFRKGWLNRINDLKYKKTKIT